MLEGAQPVIEALYARIKADPRHDGVRLNEAGPVPKRLFAKWAMAVVAEHHEADMPMVATTGGLAQGAPWRVALEQEAILTRLRDLTGGGRRVGSPRFHGADHLQGRPRDGCGAAVDPGSAEGFAELQVPQSGQIARSAVVQGQGLRRQCSSLRPLPSPELSQGRPQRWFGKSEQVGQVDFPRNSGMMLRARR